MARDTIYFDPATSTFKPIPYSASSGSANDEIPASMTELNKKAPKTVELTGILTVAGWSAGSGPPYTQTITIVGITTDSKGVMSLNQSATSAQYNSAAIAMLRPSAQDIDSVTITAEGLKPTINIPVVVSITT